MANIRVNCPTCKAELEIGEEYVGQEVECGKCLQPFKAEDSKSVKKPYKMQRSRDDAGPIADSPRSHGKLSSKPLWRRLFPIQSRSIIVICVI